MTPHVGYLGSKGLYLGIVLVGWAPFAQAAKMRGASTGATLDVIAVQVRPGGCTKPRIDSRSTAANGARQSQCPSTLRAVQGSR